jgi:hypothetical protein
MGHDPGGFRVWWRVLTGSDETLENAYLMRLAGRFSRRVRGYAKAHRIPVTDCPVGQSKHELMHASAAINASLRILDHLSTSRDLPIAAARSAPWHRVAGTRIRKTVRSLHPAPAA